MLIRLPSGCWGGRWEDHDCLSKSHAQSWSLHRQPNLLRGIGEKGAMASACRMKGWSGWMDNGEWRMGKGTKCIRERHCGRSRNRRAEEEADRHPSWWNGMLYTLVDYIMASRRTRVYCRLCPMPCRVIEKCSRQVPNGPEYINGSIRSIYR
jgi:hypothetical protein